MTPVAATARQHLALGLVSASLLAFQVILMQLLATSQWYHFAHLVISIALLGFGAAGSLLAITRRWLLSRQETLMPLLLIASALALVAPLGVSQALFGGFDSYLVFVNLKETLKLAAAALLLMLPFGCGALVIGMLFTSQTRKIGSFYFANLLGSGCGALLGLLGLELSPPGRLPPLCALLSILAAWLLIRPGQLRLKGAVLIVSAGILFSAARPPAPVYSEYKDIRRALMLPEATVMAYEPAAAGQVHVIQAPVLRSAPGVSLKWSGKIPSRPVAFINGNAVGGIPLRPELANPLQATARALPYVLSSPRRVLILNAGTGAEVPLALQHGATEVTAVEPHRKLARVLSAVAPQTFGQILSDPRVSWQTTEPRSWLARATGRYDLITLPQIGTFGGNAGLFALQEHPLLTRQALSQAWQHLQPDGFLSVSTWLDQPVRKPARLLATLLAALEDNGVERPAEHIAAVRSWGTLTYCIKRTPLQAHDIAVVRSFATRWGFDPLLLPGLRPGEREVFHRLQDHSLFKLVDALMAGERQELSGEYPFRIRPPTDDRPFFTQFMRWGHVTELLQHFGKQNLPFLEVGLLVAALAALTLSGLAALLIILPLFVLPRATRRGGATGLYFGGLAIGYMWVELGLVHQLVFYLGQPVLAAALVISVLLVGSGVGSYLSGRARPRHGRRWAGLVAVFVLGYALWLEPLLALGLSCSLPLRLLVSVVVTLPVAIMMGFPFPLGLRRLDGSRPAEVPWAWGINGCLSVVGAAVATLLAVEIGFAALLLCAAVAYLLPAITSLA